MMDRMHTRLGITDITLTNPINKTSTAAAISSTTCGYLNQQELNYQQQQQQQQQQRIQQQQTRQHSGIAENIEGLSVASTTCSNVQQTPTSSTSAHNQALHQQTHAQHLIQSHQTLNAPTAQYSTAASKPSFSSLLQHTIDNSKHDNHSQHHLSEEHLHTHSHTPHHLSNQSVYNHLHHHAPTHYTLNHLNHHHNHRSVAADCLTAAALAATSPVTSPSAISISSTTSGCVSVTPSSAMAVAAAAHLHHNSQTSPMTNLHQNMGSLMNSGNSAR